MEEIYPHMNKIIISKDQGSVLPILPLTQNLAEVFGGRSGK